jgi:hypothetical protein
MLEPSTVLKESRQLVEGAQIEVEFSKRVAANFLHVEVELSGTFSQMALDSFAAGHIERARRTAAAAKEAYATVHKFLPKLLVHDRESIEAKLATLDALIGKLAAIK